MSDPQKYRTKEELEEYKQRDPIEQVRSVILKKKWSSEEDLKEIDKKIKARVQECVDFAEESDWPPASDAYTDVYAEENYPFVTD